MHANSEPEQDGATFRAGESLQLSPLLGYAALIFSEADEVKRARMGGTIDARVEAAHDHYFGPGSETLIRGVPVASKMRLEQPLRGQLRTKDLVAELHTINSQIHRMMFQVERAVARLATGG